MAPRCPLRRRRSEAVFNEVMRDLTRERADVVEAVVDFGADTVVDFGAEASVGGTKALELLGKLLGPEQLLIDREDRPWFICEDGSLQKVKAKVTFHTPARRIVGKQGFYVLGAPAG